MSVSHSNSFLNSFGSFKIVFDFTKAKKKQKVQILIAIGIIGFDYWF